MFHWFLSFWRRCATVSKSALCEAFHKADYAKSLIMESSWPAPPREPMGSGQFEFQPLHNYSAFRKLISESGAR
ncbi:hypothetical protein OKW29_004873 [Paraburkholderia sp. CI3]